MKNKLFIGAFALMLALGVSHVSYASTSLTEFRTRVDTVSTRMQDVMSKFNSIIARAQAKGFDMNGAQALYDDAVAKHVIFKADIDTLRTMLTGATGMTPEIHTQVEKTKADFKILKDSVKAARERMRQVIEAHRSAANAQ